MESSDSLKSWDMFSCPGSGRMVFNISGLEAAIVKSLYFIIVLWWVLFIVLEFLFPLGGFRSFSSRCGWLCVFSSPFFGFGSLLGRMLVISVLCYARSRPLLGSASVRGPLAEAGFSMQAEVTWGFLPLLSLFACEAFSSLLIERAITALLIQMSTTSRECSPTASLECSSASNPWGWEISSTAFDLDDDIILVRNQAMGRDSDATTNTSDIVLLPNGMICQILQLNWILVVVLRVEIDSQKVETIGNCCLFTIDGILDWCSAASTLG